MSDDLISRKALIADCRKYVKGTPLQEMFETIIDSQPTAYDVDGVVEQLNKELSFSSGYPICSEYDYAYECATNDSRKKAIEIVKAGGVQNE